MVSHTIVEEFLRYHGNEEAKELAELLSRISSIQDVDKFPILKTFRYVIFTNF